MASNDLSPKQRDELVSTLKKRFEKNMSRHKGLTWSNVEAKLKGKSGKIHSLFEMEKTGGEPDVVVLGKKTNEFIFVDCSPETPAGRRSICYDAAALNARKEHKPKDSAENMAKKMGIELLSEEEYRELQSSGEYDTKTSSWVKTPSDIRKKGGAIFCDRRYGVVFTYHNGAESYYAGRGFRGKLTL